MTKAKILIVEDENIVAKDIENFLLKLGHNIIAVVPSAEQALEEIKNSKPDLVLMDIMLKGQMTGIDAAAIIRESYKIPVIFLTAFADEKTLEKAKKTEPYGYIMKPFKDKELQVTIEMALDKHEKDLRVRKERDLYHSLVIDKSSNDSIFVRANFRLNRIKYDDLYFIEALKDYVVINTGDNQFTTHATMKEMERILPETEFVRIHRSHIVRIDKIFSIKYPDLVIEGKMKVLPIGALYRKKLFTKLNMI